MDVLHALAVIERALNRAALPPGCLPANQALREAARRLLVALPAPALAAERAQIEAALAAPTLRIDAAFEHSLAAFVAGLREDVAPAVPGLAAAPDVSGGYQPNVIPLRSRLGRGALAAFVLAYAVRGLWNDDLIIMLTPRDRSSEFHLHGMVAWTMALAMLCGMAVLLAVVVDHYDRRDNEAAYRRFSEWAAVWAWGLFLLALLMHLVTWLIVLLTG